MELYAKGPGDSAYAKVATDSAPSATGSFAYTATKGDGNYSFYTLAVDNAGNTETTPASADATTAVDATAPASAASAPAFATAGTFAVSYTASDIGQAPSGLGRVELYAKGPNDSAYAKVATNSTPGASGSFSYTATQGDGTYRFYTLATDKATNTETAPSSADATTALDTATPTSTAASPATATSSAWTVSYTASDPGAGASGLARVELYAKGPADSAYAKVATDSAPSATGSFGYTATKGDGNYGFYTLAIDNAGNTETAPSAADTTTNVPPDTTPPTSSATSPQYATGAFTVSYTAGDNGAFSSGLGRVELYAKGPGDSAYAKVATDNTPAATGSFNYTATQGDGNYRFYTIATDNKANTETVPEQRRRHHDGRCDGAGVVGLVGADLAEQRLHRVLHGLRSGSGASGLGRVELYAKGPGDSAYAKVATDNTPGATGTFNYTATQGDGNYRFYTIATDNAGNTQTAPTSADTTTAAGHHVARVGRQRARLRDGGDLRGQLHGLGHRPGALEPRACGPLRPGPRRQQLRQGRHRQHPRRERLLQLHRHPGRRQLPLLHPRHRQGHQHRDRAEQRGRHHRAGHRDPNLHRRLSRDRDQQRLDRVVHGLRPGRRRVGPRARRALRQGPQ